MTDKIRAHMTACCTKCDICVCSGPIAWQGHTLRLFTAFLCCFDLPIGTATGETKYSELAVQRRAEPWTACAAYAPTTPVTSCHALLFAVQSVLLRIPNSPKDSCYHWTSKPGQRNTSPESCCCWRTWRARRREPTSLVQRRQRHALERT